ncbi:endo-1,3(4)-beta-glucanase [Exophiala viscosa]|uniref:endo-1,3(4)-beta-glucanase n=1 Tax=Exophiala viscosa TaxID=2486360 RepID=A0AAN6DW70_9EURO|nr:endo-1,3(4)-beta-glucanase [Exophiala viscosa]
MHSSTLFTLAGLVSLSTAGYVLEDDYSGDSFFSMFDFFTGTDPTNGYVNYVDQSTAQSDGLISTNGSAIYMGVDHTNVASGSGRSSVRLTSTKSYTHALILLDLEHMPGGVCGTWPAFWTVGPNWPNSGEIDIIEGVNSQVGDSMALHTGSGCSITNNGDFSGSITTPNCNVDASGQATNAGCQVLTSAADTYGTGFNNGEGGVYATEWTSSAITIWFFPRSSIPSDVSSGSPDPSGWGTPLSQFQGGCDIDDFFEDHQIVFDTTFCGDWAGNVWTTDATCSSKASTCQDFVQNNPSAFVDAYWSVNSLKVYQSNGASNTTSSASPQSSSAAATATVPVSSGSSSAWNFGVSSAATASAVPTSGFSRGGNGRKTKTFGTAKDVVATVTSAVEAAVSDVVATATSAVSAAVSEDLVAEATVTATATVSVTGTGTGSSVAETTPSTTVVAETDDSSDDVSTHYVTVTALTYEEVTNDEKKRAPATQDLDKVKRQMQSHRHLRRHLFRHRGSMEE